MKKRMKVVATIGAVAAGIGAMAAYGRDGRDILKTDAASVAGVNPVVSEWDEARSEGPTDGRLPKCVLITGAHSYVGTHVESFLAKWPERYSVDTLDMVGDSWRAFDFSGYDVVYHVAGIAHADIGTVSEGQKQLYYDVNTTLAVETAERAKASGVGQFILMSSMIIYGNAERIDATTEPNPSNFYGDSKWQADKAIRSLGDDRFKVVVLRPPMIYGRGSKGNYPVLSQIARNVPIFPRSINRRSILYIDNLCNFVKLMIDNEESGIFFPQNSELVSTSQIVRSIAAAHGRRIAISNALAPVTFLGKMAPGKAGNLSRKAFGTSMYSLEMSRYKEPYVLYGFEESIRRTELPVPESPADGHDRNGTTYATRGGMRILAVSQYYWPEPFNVSEICEELVRRGNEVTVLTGLPNYPEGNIYGGYGNKASLEQAHNGVRILRVKDHPRKQDLASRVANYYSFSSRGSKRARLMVEDFDAIIAFTISPVMSANPAIAAAETTKAPLLNYVIDLWPECLLSGGIKRDSAVYRHYANVSRRIYASADRLAVTSPSFRDYLSRLLGHEVTATYLPQYAEDAFGDIDEGSLVPRDDFPTNLINLTFAGNIGSAQSVETIIRAAHELGHGQFLFHIVGAGTELDVCERLADALGVGNVIFHGRLPLEEMPNLYAHSDAMVATFANLPVLGFTLPRKIQSYMASGRPIIASAVGESRRVIEDARCGVCCDAADYQALAGCCRDFANLSASERKDLGANARSYYEGHFSKGRFFDTLEDELERLKGTRHGFSRRRP